MAITDKLTAIADAIRSKTNTSRLIRMDEMPALITSIAGEGVAEYVNFYDYDGTLLHQYTVAEFFDVTEMPALPDNLAGGRCTGWNYDLETIKAIGTHVNVAAIYCGVDATDAVENEAVTVDGTKLYFTFDKETTITFYYRQSSVNAVTIEWGDGNHYTNSSYSGSSNISVTHTYPKGDYVMTFTIAEGKTLSLGQGSTSYSVLGSCSISSTTCPQLISLKKAEIDTRNTILLSSAFRYCIGLEEVIFGDGTNRTIPSYAFDYCMGLERVHISNAITQISDYAFRQCYRLRDVVIPNSVTTLGSYAFIECRRLRSVHIAGSVTAVNTSAFQNCTALSDVILDSGIKTIGANAFNGCLLLRSVNLPNTITSIGTQAFVNCQALRHITLPTGIRTVGSGAFQGAIALRTVVIPEGITTIDTNAFNGCTALAFAALPRTLLTIGQAAFNACTHLQNAVFAEGLTTVNTNAFSNTSALEYISIPTTVTTLGLCAFQNCKALKNILLPTHLATQTGFMVSCSMVSEKTVKVYKNILEGCTTIQNNAFQACSGLEETEVPDGITSIGNSAFSDNRGLKKVTFPLGVTTIGSNAFSNCGNIEKITLPRTVTSVGASAFLSCVSLKDADLPAVVSTLGASAFQNCYGLEKITIRRNGGDIPNLALNHCHRLLTVNFPSVVKKATLTGECFSYSGLRETPVFPENTTVSGSGLFSNCYALEKADLFRVGNPVGTGIPNAFYCCFALSELKLPENLVSVASNIAQQAYALAGEIEIPTYVWSIGSRAFYQCYNIEGIKFLGGYVNTINSEAFAYCYKLREVHLPHTITTMQKCFNYCYGLRKIYMYALTPPTGTTTIGDLANDYMIYVPRGSLDAYKARFTSHSSRMEEFDYMMPVNKLVNRTICISDTSMLLRNVVTHTELPEGATFTVECTYGGQNLQNIHNATFDAEANTLYFEFDRATDFDFSVEEDMNISIRVNEIDLGCEFTVALAYRTDDFRSEYEVINVSGYGFTLDSEGFYVSGNKGVQNSYSLCRIRFTTSTGKLYLECNGAGEANYDFGLVSKLDVMLGANNNADADAYLTKSFKGQSSYNQTLEIDINDTEEHFICCKYRKDGSVDSGLDRFRFKVRFE